MTINPLKNGSDNISDQTISEQAKPANPVSEIARESLTATPSSGLSDLKISERPNLIDEEKVKIIEQLKPEHQEIMKIVLSGDKKIESLTPSEFIKAYRDFADESLRQRKLDSIFELDSKCNNIIEKKSMIT